MSSRLLDPAAILYGDLAPANPRLGLDTEIDLDGQQLYRVTRKLGLDWEGKSHVPPFASRWSDAPGAEPTTFYTTDPEVKTWEQAQETYSLHRIAGPAATWDDRREAWFLHGLRHRTDGPGWIYVREDGLFVKRYYLDGRPMCKREWAWRLPPRQV